MKNKPTKIVIGALIGAIVMFTCGFILRLLKYVFQAVMEVVIIVFHPFVNIFLKRLLSPLSSRGKAEVVIVDRWLYANPLHLLLKVYLEKKRYCVMYVNVRMNESFEESGRRLADIL